ncbi:hypothetical protein Tco_0919679 [Tanacetum coccineum]
MNSWIGSSLVTLNKRFVGGTPCLSVDCPDCDDSRARGFVLRSLGLHILSFIWKIRYPNLIDQRFSLSILNKQLRICVEETDIREKDEKSSKKRTKPGTKWKGMKERRKAKVEITRIGLQRELRAEMNVRVSLTQQKHIMFSLSEETHEEEDKRPKMLKEVINSFYAFSDSLLLTQLCCDNIYDVTPRVSALAGCDNKHHNLDDDMMVKNIFNSGKHKDRVGMKLPSWMITDKMKLIENYRMYATVFEVEVPTTQSQPIESTQKSHDELEAKQNVQKVEEHLIAEEIEKLVEGAENVENVEISAKVQPVNINEVEEESTEDDYELKRRGKVNHVEESRSTPSSTTINPPPSSSTPSSSSSKLKLSATNRLLSLFKPKPGCFKRYKSFFDKLQGRYIYLFKHLKIRFMPRKKFNVLAQHLQEIMEESLPTMNSAKKQKTSEHGTYVFGESSSGQDYESEPGPSTSHQEQLDDFDFWTNSYATDDDEIPIEKVSQELVNEMSQIVDEAKLCKVVDEMLRQRCTSGDEHQYHIDQMQNFLKNDIVWESRKEILVSPHPQRPTPIFQSCQRDPKAPTLSLVNQDLLYLKKGSSGPEKIVMPLHKFPVVIFPDDDIEERTSRWVDKAQKAKGSSILNSKIVQIIKTYWELGHEHKFITEIVASRANGSIMSITKLDYKNLNKNDIEDMYLLIVNNKVDDYAKTGLLMSLSVFIRSTVIWERLHDFQLGVKSYQQKVNLTAPTITFLGNEKYNVFSIVSEPVYDIIYKNNKKEKRVMRHQEVHKFCDATLKRVLEGLKSYNNDVKHGYVTPSLSNEDVEYLQLFEEEIEKRLKHREQMRRWEMYVNGRPLG